VNAFTDLAERQIAAPRKARMRAAEARAACRAEKALAERDDLFRLWKHARRAQVDAALAGPHGEALSQLVVFLDQATMVSVVGLTELVRAGDWGAADPDVRFLVLDLIGNAIMRLRERDGLEPFDDGLPGEPPTTFQIVRELLR
jgi:hypothetical protein